MGLTIQEEQWLERFVNRLREHGLTDDQITYVIDADGAELHLDLSPEECADNEVKEGSYKNA